MAMIGGPTPQPGPAAKAPMGFGAQRAHLVGLGIGRRGSRGAGKVRPAPMPKRPPTQTARVHHWQGPQLVAMHWWPRLHVWWPIAKQKREWAVAFGF